MGRRPRGKGWGEPAVAEMLYAADLFDADTGKTNPAQAKAHRAGVDEGPSEAADSTFPAMIEVGRSGHGCRD
jgi:hypothetical protein